MKHTRLGYWIEEAGEVEPRPALSGRHEADVLVVGGGYPGRWTAWYARALEPEARVVLLVAEAVCGRGPSGRNGGFCEALWFSLATSGTVAYQPAVAAVRALTRAPAAVIAPHPDL